MTHLLTNIAEYAIIFNDKKEFLLLQWGEDCNFTWHFPGGRMDDGDQEISGLERELDEEIAAQVVDLAPVYTKFISTKELQKYVSGAKGRYAVFYTAKLKGGCIPKLVTKDHIAMKWFSQADIPKINFWLPFYREMMETVYKRS